MQNYNSPRTLSLFSSSCRASTGSFEPDITSNEALFVTVPCAGTALLGVSCKHPNINVLIENVGGLSFKDKTLSNSVVASALPFFIPEGVSNPAVSRHLSCVAFSLRDVLTSRGKIYAGAYHAPRVFKFSGDQLKAVGQNSRTILFLTGNDALIETMTNTLGVVGAAEAITRLGADYVVAPDYSAFFGECVVTHRYNQMRSFMFAKALTERGVHVVPHIFPSNPINTELYIQWLKASRLSLVAINAQMHKSLTDQYVLIDMVGDILRNTDDHLHVLLQGCRRDSLRRLGHLVRRVHVTSRVPVTLVQSSTLADFDTESNTIKRTPSPFPRELLLEANLDAYKNYWSSLVPIGFGETYRKVPSLTSVTH